MELTKKLIVLEIRTVEDDPRCLREISHGWEYGRVLADAIYGYIYGYRKGIGSFPTREQILAAITRDA